MLKAVTKFIMKLAGTPYAALEREFNAIESEYPLSKEERAKLKKLSDESEALGREARDFLEKYSKKRK